MKFRVLDHRHSRAVAVVYEDENGVVAYFPYVCRSRRRRVEAPSLEEVSAASFRHDAMSEVRLSEIREAPDPPKHHWWESMAGLLQSRLAYVCEKCGAVGKPVFYGLDWREMLEEEDRASVIIREQTIMGEDKTSIEARLAQSDFACGECGHEWNGEDVIWRDGGVSWSKSSRAEQLEDGRIQFRLHVDGYERRGHVDTRGRVRLWAPTPAGRIEVPDPLRAARIRELLREYRLLPSLTRLTKTGPWVGLEPEGVKAPERRTLPGSFASGNEEEGQGGV